MVRRFSGVSLGMASRRVGLTAPVEEVEGPGPLVDWDSPEDEADEVEDVVELPDVDEGAAWASMSNSSLAV
jgi:hypothetical protein